MGIRTSIRLSHGHFSTQLSNSHHVAEIASARLRALGSPFGHGMAKRTKNKSEKNALVLHLALLFVYSQSTFSNKRSSLLSPFNLTITTSPINGKS